MVKKCIKIFFVNAQGHFVMRELIKIVIGPWSYYVDFSANKVNAPAVQELAVVTETTLKTFL